MAGSWLLLPLAALAADLPDLTDAPRTGASTPQDAAVVVGIDDYAYLPDVPHAENDAAAFRAMLVDSRGLPSAQAHRLIGTPSREEIEDAFDQALGQVGPDGLLWLYFAGHGLAGEDGGRLLIGADAKPATVDDRALSLHDLDARARAEGVRLVAVVDACYNGLGRGGESVTGGARSMVPVGVLDQQASVWAATSGSEQAWPLPGAEHGAFTFFVVTGLRGWADGALGGGRDGQVTAGEVQRFVFDRMADAGLREQSPVLHPADLAELVVVEGRRLESEPRLDYAALASQGASATAGSARVETGSLVYVDETIRNVPTDAVGLLYVDTDPGGATITVDGEPWGLAPVQRELMAGEYLVTAELPLYHPVQQRITVSTEGTRATLEPAPAFGRLTVESVPTGAAVLVDGLAVGSTPLSLDRHPSGRHEVQVMLDRYLPARETVVVEDEGTARVDVELSPNFGGLAVSSDPLGASILLDGKRTAFVTPHTFEGLQPGVVQIGLELEGYGRAGTQATIENEALAEVSIPLHAKLGTLVVTSRDGSTPCSGEVFVDGSPDGETPWKRQLTATRHRVVVKCGDKVAEQQVSVVHNETVEVDLAVAVPWTPEELAARQRQAELLLDARRKELEGDARLAESEAESHRTAALGGFGLGAVLIVGIPIYYMTVLGGDYDPAALGLSLSIGAVSTGFGAWKLVKIGRARGEVRAIEAEIDALATPGGASVTDGPVDLVTFSPDGVHGAIADENLGVWYTRDGGRTWTDLVWAGAAPNSISLTFDGQQVFVWGPDGLHRWVDGRWLEERTPFLVGQDCRKMGPSTELPLWVLDAGTGHHVLVQPEASISEFGGALALKHATPHEWYLGPDSKKYVFRGQYGCGSGDAIKWEEVFTEREPEWELLIRRYDMVAPDGVGKRSGKKAPVAFRGLGGGRYLVLTRDHSIGIAEGRSFEQTGTLPGEPLRSAFTIGDNPLIYVATDQGVLISTDLGRSFVPLSQHLLAR